jgi:hypothetical protein
MAFRGGSVFAKVPNARHVPGAAWPSLLKTAKLSALLVDRLFAPRDPTKVPGRGHEISAALTLLILVSLILCWMCDDRRHL